MQQLIYYDYVLELSMSRVLESKDAIALYGSHEEHYAAKSHPPPPWIAWSIVTFAVSLLYVVPIVFFTILGYWLNFAFFRLYRDDHEIVTMDIIFLGLTLLQLYLFSTRNLPIFNKVAAFAHAVFDIFNTRVIVDQSKFANVPRPYLVAMAPHGIAPIGAFMFDAYLKEYLPGLHGTMCVASIAFYLPVLRQIPISIRAVAATASNMLKRLSRGSNIYLVPGGIAEIFLSSREEERICASHKGFVKIALKAGVPIVPVYIFGHTRLYDQPKLDGGPMMAISRILKTSITIFWGQYYTFKPYPTSMTFAIGAPIGGGAKVEHPTQEQVDQLHGLYLQEIERLYHAHKLEAGYANTPFRFIH